MANFDLPLHELEHYRPSLAVPDDLDEFWDHTLSQARRLPLDATFTQVDNHLSTVITYDVSFAGYGGTRVNGWLSMPKDHDGPLPALVQFQGYNGGRGLGHEHTLWASAGYAHLVVDTRGQGCAGLVGATADDDPAGGPSVAGFMTRGILHQDTYYYRRVFTDAVRAIEAVRGHDRVDPSRVAVIGGSQGGGIALAVASLVPDLSGVCADVPFLCNFPRSVSLVDSSPYSEIQRYLKAHRDQVDRVFETLSYFDASVLVRRANAPALFSVGLMDHTCPPSSVFAAYNHYPADKQIRVYHFNDHEGGANFQQREQLRWLADLLKP